MTVGQAEGRAGGRIGRYLVTGRIGRGGMGMVYRAFDESLERELAIKILTAEAGESEEHRQRFAIEAKAAAKLQHPNIVTVFELGEDRGVPFIAMELLSGADLEALLKSGEPLLLEEKLDIVIQLCRGLHYAHEHRIIHRDVKPSNVRVLEDGTAKILDFGIAKLGATGVTRSGMMVGTVHYMSPEQVRGQALDGRSDVFSVGVILYQLLCGRRPFLGDSATAILYKIVHEAPPPLEVELGEAGEAVEQVLRRALAKDPAARCPSAAALADDLVRALAAHLRTVNRELPVESQESLTLGRRLLKEGRIEESLAR
ncbi:MAG TPA: serine/threonine-protein kinase, partial [Vicinamibacteria bacterium]